MANNNQIELVVTVEVDKANQSIKSVNANLSGIEAAATKSALAASHGIDGMTASMAKGALAGNLLADAIKKAIEFAKEWRTDRMMRRLEAMMIVTDGDHVYILSGDGNVVEPRTIFVAIWKNRAGSASRLKTQLSTIRGELRRVRSRVTIDSVRSVGYRIGLRA